MPRVSPAPVADNTNSLPAPLTVSQLTAQIKGVVEDCFPGGWVAGEISNFSRPQSGHCYFTLKDEKAQIRAVMWNGVASRLNFDLHDGLEIVCHGHLDVYAPRGSYQLVVDQAHPQGVGALELALRQLKEKLAREGLFDASRKRPLPKFPRRIGFVTSPTGAAVRDFLEVLRRRWAQVEVMIIPSRVQGDGAAAEIVAGIALANRVQPLLDVLVVGRGGGSIEDLWCFNEEVVLRAIAASTIPTVSAVGHEIDVTLADLVADVRALTPTEAAERLLPPLDEIRAQLTRAAHRVHAAMWRRANLTRQRLEGIASRRIFLNPMAIVEDRTRRVDELAARARRAAATEIKTNEHRLATLTAKVESLSPLGVLARGYTVTHDEASGQVVRSAQQLKPGQRLVTRFLDGERQSVVADEN